MPEYSLEEAREQAIKTGRYFSRVLAEHKMKYLAVRIEGVTFVIASGARLESLETLVEEEWDGEIQAPHPAQLAAVPDPSPSDLGSDKVNEPLAAGSRRESVILIPLYHESSGEHANKPGHIHLHVLKDEKLGRRVRKSGECLCGKKRGTKERTPREGERTMCAECVRVADQHGISWTLAL